MAGPFAPSGRRAAARRRTPGVLGPRARPRPRCGLGLGAALRAGLAARASAQPSPHAARAAWCCGRQGRGMPALRAGGGSRPRPLGASLPPPPSGLRAATPAHPGRLGRRPPRPPVAVGVMWRLVAACGGSGLRPCGACQPPAVARGHLPAPQGQAPCGGRFAGLAPLLPLAGRGVGAPGRPAPTRGGFWGGAALRPGRARLRPAAPRWPACGSASAWPSRRSGPAPLAASRRRAAGRRPRPCGARPVRGRNLDAARKGLARVAGRGPIPRRARLWRGVAPPAGGSATWRSAIKGDASP